MICSNKKISFNNINDDKNNKLFYSELINNLFYFLFKIVYLYIG